MTETPRYGHAPIKMVPRANRDFWEGPEHKPGEFYFETRDDGKHWLMVILPFRNADGKFINIPTEVSIGHPNNNGAVWQWDGNEEHPTITPSIHTHGVWHGWVRNGELVEA